MLTKEQILESPSKLRIQKVPVPEWGEGAEVCVRELTGDERDKFDTTVTNAGGSIVGIRSWLVAMGLCDEDGNSMGFTEAEIKQLGAKQGIVIDRLFEVINEMSGMGSESVKEAEKNSQTDQSESSG